MTGKQRGVSLDTKKQLYGYLFLIPFFIGFVFFFLSPLIFYVMMAFSRKHDGMNFTFTGLENIQYVLLNEPEYLVSVFDSLKSLLLELLTIVLFSLFIAVLLNQKFRGRGFVRAMFFLPVIVSSGIVAVDGQGDLLINNAQSLLSGAVSTGNVQMSQNISESILSLFGNNALMGNFVNVVSGIVTGMYEVTQKAGVQILIFLSGLQTVSASIYEASRIDGATGWETFWKITLPMVSPMILVNTVYTAIDLLASMDNQTITTIYEKALNLQYADSAAMGVMYLSVVLTILAVIIFLISRFVYYEDKGEKRSKRGSRH